MFSSLAGDGVNDVGHEQEEMGVSNMQHIANA